METNRHLPKDDDPAEGARNLPPGRETPTPRIESEEPHGRASLGTTSPNDTPETPEEAARTPPHLAGEEPKKNPRRNRRRQTTP